MLWALGAILILVVLFALFVLSVRRKIHSGDGQPAMRVLLATPRIVNAMQLQWILEPELGPVEEVERIDKPEVPGFQSDVLVQGHLLRITCDRAPKFDLTDRILALLFDRAALRAIPRSRFALTIECLREAKDKNSDPYRVMAEMMGLLTEKDGMALMIG